MKILVFQTIAEISKEKWAELTPPEFPFASYDFISALETTGCVGERSGWSPIYVTAWHGETLSGAMVTYVKTNSYGEYIFDFAWANAYEQLGLAYYPKLVAAIPFTPATGPKILLRTDLDLSARNEVEQGLIRGALELTSKMKLSSTHALFIKPEEQTAFEEAGFFIRQSFQYHWRNTGYKTFGDFMQALRSKRRTELRRERTQVEKSGVKISRLTGSSLTRDYADIMYKFYLDTVSKRGGFDYLTRAFFRKVFEVMPDKIMLAVAENADGETVAGALNYFGASTLFGRNWGCLEDYKALHFELCYYQGIDFAIEKGFELFEAGAQGEHKFQRGFLPAVTLSAHRLENTELLEPIKDFVAKEKRQIARMFKEYDDHTPFSREQV